MRNAFSGDGSRHTPMPFCQTVEEIYTPQGVIVVRMYLLYSIRLFGFLEWCKYINYCWNLKDKILFHLIFFIHHLLIHLKNVTNPDKN